MGMKGMNLYLRIADLDELQYRIHCAIELVRMVHTSITQGENEPTENDYDGLFAAWNQLDNLNEELKADIEKLYDAYRNYSHGEETA